MKITGTVELRNSHWAGVKKHVEHDESINHSNEYLNGAQSELERSLNLHGNCAKEENVIEKFYGGSKLKKWNQRQEKNRHYDKICKSARQFANLGKGTFDMTGVATFGNKSDKEMIFERVEKLLDPKSDKEKSDLELKVLKSISKGLAKHAKGFNRRNSEMTLTSWYTNVDEDGAPHLHFQVIPHAKKKNGDTSSSLDSALRAQGFNGSSRDALSKWREQEDKNMIKCVAKSLREDFPHFGNLTLYRNNAHGGLSQEMYKQQQEIKKSTESLASNEAKLASSAASLALVASEVDSSVRAASSAAASVRARKFKASTRSANSFARSVEASANSFASSTKSDALSAASSATSMLTKAANANHRNTKILENGYRLLFPNGLHHKGSKKDIIHDLAAGRTTYNGKNGYELLIEFIVNAIEFRLQQLNKALKKELKNGKSNDLER